MDPRHQHGRDSAARMRLSEGKGSEMTTETPTDDLAETIITVLVINSDAHEHCELSVPDAAEEGHPGGRQCMQPAIKRVRIDLQDGEEPTVWTVCEWHVSDAIGLAS